MNWIYIAGFFDGEGSVCPHGKGFRITISQTNEEVLNGICLFVGRGRVIKVTKRKNHWKDAWVYFIAKQEDVDYFLRSIVNNLVVKRNQVRLIIKRLRLIISNQKMKKLRQSHLIARTKLLRKKGFTYRDIGNALGIDWGYARRLTMK